MRACKGRRQGVSGVCAADAKTAGVTLIEIMVAMGISSIVLAAAMGVYFFAIAQWNTGAADVDAFVTASAGAERMCNDIARARYATIVTMPDGREILRVGVYPLTVDLGGAEYFPDAEDAGYDPGPEDEYWFYRSDATGSVIASGDILWRAYKQASAAAIKDNTWTFFEGTSRPRVSGVTGLDFTVYPDTNLVYVFLEVQGAESGAAQPRRIVRWTHMRSHE